MNHIIQKNPGRFWGFAYLWPRTEKLMERRLRGAGIDCYLPLLPKARVHHSTKIITEIPMIPGYIFLCVDDRERYELKRQEPKFVQIELLREEHQENRFIQELNALRQCEQLAREAPILVNPDIMAGDKVLVTAGALKGLVTDVVRREDGQNLIVINITILNRHVEYSVPSETLSKITA